MRRSLLAVFLVTLVGCSGAQTVVDTSEDSQPLEAPPSEDTGCPAKVWEGDFHAESSADLTRLEGVTKITGSLTLVSRNSDDEVYEARCDTIHICSFEQLSCLQDVEGSIRIAQNHMELVNLEGLNRLAHIRGTLTIEHNSVLATLEGLEALEAVGGLYLNENERLVSVEGLGSLETAGAIFIINNNSLTNLDGLSSLRAVVGDVSLEANDALTSLSGLSSLVSIGGMLEFLSNYGLESLNGLEGITEIGGTISFVNNRHLPTCEAEAFIRRLTGAGWHGEPEVQENDDSATCAAATTR